MEVKAIEFDTLAQPLMIKRPAELKAAGRWLLKPDARLRRHLPERGNMMGPCRTARFALNLALG